VYVLNSLKRDITFCELLDITIPEAQFLRMRDSYTNPYESKRIESFEIFGLTNRNESNLLRFLVLRNESTIRILKVRIRESGFANPKLQDS
jgi:hypothetical protein